MSTFSNAQHVDVETDIPRVSMEKTTIPGRSLPLNMDSIMNTTTPPITTETVTTSTETDTDTNDFSSPILPPPPIVPPPELPDSPLTHRQLEQRRRQLSDHISPTQQQQQQQYSLTQSQQPPPFKHNNNTNINDNTDYNHNNNDNDNDNSNNVHQSSHLFATTTTTQKQKLDTDDDDQYNSDDIEKANLKFYNHPFTSTKEPFRDVNGPITIHRIITLVWIGGIMTAFFFLQRFIWDDDKNSDYSESWIASPYLGFILIIALPSAILSFIGALWYRENPNLDKVQPMSYNVVFRIVSRGVNQECLNETIHVCQREMKNNSFFPYLIEVVTDADVYHAPDDPDVIQLKVPPSYVTENQTKFKARALHYACERSIIPGNTWVVHLDEETQPTSSAIKGIAKMISECEESGDITRIGQGCILYHRAFSTHPFLTLADMRRTGDDFGHFFLQHRIGRTIFGLHGAFIVCRHDTEASVGFDIGPEGSITEDAWWILLAMKRGYRTCWVDGYLEEQSTQSMLDFLKQRRRWTYGLIKVAWSNPVPFHYRMWLAWFIFTWILVPFLLPLQIGYTIILIIFNLPISIYFRIPTIFIVTMQFYVYFIGFIVNIREYRKLSWWKIPFWFILQLILVPIFLIMEIIAVLISFCAGCTQNGKGFHVVQKSATNAEQEKKQREREERKARKSGIGGMDEEEEEGDSSSSA